MRDRYSEYTNDTLITVPKRKLFTDAEGFPNENAFRSFVEPLTEDDGCYLACISIDLTASNESGGYAFGTLMLRKVYLQLKDNFFVFRVSGDKFNIIVPEGDFEKAEQMLSSCDAELLTIYYGFVKNQPITGENYADLRRQGIELMYQNKAVRTDKKLGAVRDDKIVGDKGNTPVELQETLTHKFRETMWYGTIIFDESEPTAREITAYIFPTEYKENFASLNMIVVVDDLIHSRVYVGNNIAFGFDGIRFTITSRFDNEGHLNIVCFKDRESKGKCEMTLHSHEGVCIPASFGKRAGKGQEIFPVKPNAYGTYDYVLWDKTAKTATLDTTGIVVMDGKNYAVHANSKGIDLIEQ